MTRLITATFKTRTAAESALQQIEAAGAAEEQIGLVVTDQTRGTSFNIDERSKAGEGAAAGAALGGLAGAALGALAGAGSIVALPGLVVTGAAAAALAGMGAGAASGGLIGALIGLGIPEHKARVYRDRIKDGGILLAVRPEDEEQAREIAAILRRADAHHIAA